MKKILPLMIVVFLSLAPAAAVWAGGGPSRPGANSADAGNGAANAPIDGGISLLLAAGVGYGAKKIHEAKKKQVKKSKEEAGV